MESFCRNLTTILNELIEGTSEYNQLEEKYDLNDDLLGIIREFNQDQVEVLEKYGSKDPESLDKKIRSQRVLTAIRLNVLRLVTCFWQQLTEEEQTTNVRTFIAHALQSSSILEFLLEEHPELSSYLNNLLRLDAQSRAGYLPRLNSEESDSDNTLESGYPNESSYSEESADSDVTLEESDSNIYSSSDSESNEEQPILREVSSLLCKPLTSILDSLFNKRLTLTQVEKRYANNTDLLDLVTKFHTMQEKVREEYTMLPDEQLEPILVGRVLLAIRLHNLDLVKCFWNQLTNEEKKEYKEDFLQEMLEHGNEEIFNFFVQLYPGLEEGLLEELRTIRILNDPNTEPFENSLTGLDVREFEKSLAGIANDEQVRSSSDESSTERRLTEILNEPDPAESYRKSLIANLPSDYQKLLANSSDEPEEKLSESSEQEDWQDRLVRLEKRGKGNQEELRAWAIELGLILGSKKVMIENIRSFYEED